MEWKNKLYFGDNLKILREYVPDASVDLIYLDPPFNSSATYNVLFKEKSGEESAAEIMAFEATVAPICDRRLLREWKTTGGHRPPLQQEEEGVYREIVERGPRKLADLMQPLRGSPFGDTMHRIESKHTQGLDVSDRRGPAVAVPP